MGLFFKRTLKSDENRLPATKPAECLGEACPNFNQQKCTDATWEWIVAGGPTKGRDVSKPPLEDEATYIIYGQTCLRGAKPELVAQRAEILQPEKVSSLEVVALLGRYGDMPAEIVVPGGKATVRTIASSE